MKKFGAKNKKLIIEIIILGLLVFLTFYMLLKDQELGAIWDAVEMADKRWLVLGVFFVIIFVCSESVIIHYMMKSLGKPVNLRNCIRYSFIGFFFSCITPSASGGQPAQIYYMKKDKIEIPAATLVLLIVTITYKLVLVLVGILLLLGFQELIHQYLKDSMFFFVLGIVLNVGTVLWMYVLIFMPKVTGRMVEWFHRLLMKVKILKVSPQRIDRLQNAMERYSSSSDYFRKNMSVVFHVILLSVFQRFCLFCSTYFVYRSFGLHGHGAFEISMLQATISIAVDMLPLPGGIGISEILFLRIFTPVFGEALVLPGMLLSRGISYYALLIISAGVSIYAHLRIIRMDKKGRGSTGL